MLNTRCFVFNPIVKEKVCRRCDKRIGHNKYYIQPVKEHKHEVPTKYKITKQEAQRIFAQSVKDGLTPEQANQKISYLRFQLRMNKLNKRKMFYKSKPNLNSKFIEGLKNVN